MRFNTSIKWSKSRIPKELAVLLGTIILTGGCLANPQGGVVTSGSATISQTQNTTTIQQSSQQAIINWQSFNIGAGEKTQFIQPNQNSVTLNRISPSQGASQIFGELTSNGKIILVNQAGIFFGSGASVNVGGIIASTSDISDANFLAGKYIFDNPSSLQGSVINQGSINVANYGLAALMGTSVVNGGVIQAHLGNVVLASGNKFTISFTSDGLVNFSVDEAANSAGVDQHGQSLKNGVTNTGTLIADGGTILLTGKAAEGVVDNVIDMQGVAQAQSADGQNGDIILSGGDAGTVNISGTLDASGTAAGQTGGTISVTGENLVAQGATLNVSGDQGGGNIFFGGNFHGQGPLMDASTVSVDPTSTFLANAITNGNGGQVAVWSNNDTEFHGTLSAQGGAASGNGGYVETSGGYLDISGADVNTLASAGSTGTWLLDPTDINIVSSSDANATYLNGTYQPTSGASNTSTINVANLIADLASSNVLITTSAFSGSGGSGSGDITVSTAINWSSANTLTLSAYRNINVNAAISNSAGGGLTLRADNTGTGTGTITGLQSGGSGSLSFTGNNSAVKVYYNATSFGTQDGGLGSGIFTNVTVSGAGSSFTPYMLVDSQTNLQNINSNLSGNYALSKNLSLTGNFTPIGNSSTPFTGNFDGQNYIINGLTVSGSSGSSYLGMFGQITGATIENLGLTNSSITAPLGSDMGTLVGQENSGTITNIYVANGIVTSSSGGGANIAGLVGIANGSISNSSFSGTVTNTGNAVTAGLVGALSASGSVTNSYATGTVQNTGGPENYLSGFVGQLNGGSITNSYSTMNIINTNNNNVAGGIVGSMGGGSVSNSYWSGTYSNGGSGITNFGGVIGRISTPGTVSNNYWNTTVSGITQGVGVGGGTGVQTGTTGETTTQLQAALPSGFSSSTWGIIPNYTDPFLLASTLAISGTITGNSGATVNIATNGANLNAVDISQSLTTTTSSNGTYYYLLNKFYVPSSTPLLLYSSSSAGSSTALAILTNDANPATINLVPNTVDIHAPSATVSNSLLGVELGSLNSSNILYSASGANVTVSGTATFITDANTTYNMDGVLTGNSSALTFNGPLVISGSSISSTGAQHYDNSVTLNSNATLSANTISFSGSVSDGSYALTLTGNGSGTNTLDLSGYNSPVNINFQTSGNNTITNNSNQTIASFSNFQTIAGNQNSQVVFSTPTILNSNTSANVNGVNFTFSGITRFTGNSTQASTLTNTSVQAISTTVSNSASQSTTSVNAAVTSVTDLVQSLINTSPTSQSINGITEQQSDTDKQQKSQSYGACGI